jgi:hypothetical protein
LSVSSKGSSTFHLHEGFLPSSMYPYAELWVVVLATGGVFVLAREVVLGPASASRTYNDALKAEVCGLSAAAFFVAAMGFGNATADGGGVPVTAGCLTTWMVVLIVKAHNEVGLLKLPLHLRLRWHCLPHMKL